MLKVRELLEQELLGMTISQKTYYNLLRKKPGDPSNPGTIDGLLAVLNEAFFTFRCRTKDEIEGDHIIKRKLIQMLFGTEWWCWGIHQGYFISRI